jgi:hypothetical protein
MGGKFLNDAGDGDSKKITVIPAQAGIQFFKRPLWIPAYAGMTMN